MDAEDQDDEELWERPTPQAYEAFFDRLAEVRHNILRDEMDVFAPEKTRALLTEVINSRPQGPPMGKGAEPRDVLASSSLSGGPNPCSAMDCRVRSARSGARFAALYSDHIWIRDPYENIAHHPHDEDDEYNYAALCSTAVALEWRALLEAGIASHVAPLCSHCLGRHIEERDLLHKPVEELEAELTGDFERSAEATVYRDDDFDELHIDYRLPPRFTGHRTADVHLTHPASRRKFSRYLGKRRRRKVLKRDLSKLDVFAAMRKPIVDEALMQAVYRGTCGASYASNLPIDLDIASRSEAPDVHPSARLLKALEHAVPVVGDVPLDLILRLRADEATAFELYRNRISAIRGQVKDEAGLREAADQLRGEFAFLERKIAARKSAFRGHLGTHAKLLAVTVVVGTATWLTGAAGLGWSTLLGALGGLPAVGEVAGKAVGISKPTTDEAEHPLYFLWKMKKASQRKL